MKTMNGLKTRKYGMKITFGIINDLNTLFNKSFMKMRLSVKKRESPFTPPVLTRI